MQNNLFDETVSLKRFVRIVRHNLAYDSLRTPIWRFHKPEGEINNCAVNPPDSSVWDIRRHMTFSESHDAQTKNGVPKYKFEELHIII